MKRGFSLIEILAAVMLSSIIALTLYRILSDVNLVTKDSLFFIDTDTQISVLRNQLEKDIQSILPIEEKAEKTLTPTTTIAQPAEKAPEDKKTKIEKVFYSSNEGENLKILSFITLNSFATFDEAKPRLCRVVYRLLKDPETQNFKLTRQETNDYASTDIINDNEGKKFLAYDLMTELKKFTVKFYYPEIVEGKVTYKEQKDWSGSEEQKLPIAPEFVEIEGETYHTESKKTQDFKFNIQILSFKQKKAPEKKQPAPQPKLAAKNSRNRS